MHNTIEYRPRKRRTTAAHKYLSAATAGFLAGIYIHAVLS